VVQVKRVVWGGGVIPGERLFVGPVDESVPQVLVVRLRRATCPRKLRLLQPAIFVIGGFRKHLVVEPIALTLNNLQEISTTVVEGWLTTPSTVYYTLEQANM